MFHKACSLGALILVLLATVACGEEVIAAGNCGPVVEEQFTEASFDEQSWQETLREYARTHPPDEETVVAIRPNTTSIRQQLEALDARILHEFFSFSGLAISVEAGRLPEVAEMQGITSASLGATGSFASCI